MAKVTLDFHKGDKVIALYGNKFQECEILSRATIYVKDDEVTEVRYETSLKDSTYSSSNAHISSEHLFRNKQEAMTAVGLDKFD